MSRELWLLRHAKSDRDVDLPDIERPLKKRGRRAAQRMGGWMKQQELIPDRILSSPAERAMATAMRVCEALDIRSDSIIQDDRLYATNVASYKSVLSECPAELQRILVVGHNPELEQLLIDMVGMASLPFTKKLMPTSAFAIIELPGDWAQLKAGSAKLIAITYAKALFDED